MIIDARSIPKNKTIETDVCIVGAGTAGMTLAKEFIDQEFRVCLLESGGLKPDKKTQELGWGEIIGHPDQPLDTARPRFVGGSSNRWHIAIGDNCIGARLRPLDEIDFKERSWVPYSGWPFNKTYLDHYYDRAQTLCKTEPSTYELEDWEDTEVTPRLPFVGERIKTVIFKFGSRIPFVKDYPEQVTHAANTTIFLYANVIKIETDESSRNVTRLCVACLNGSSFLVSAKLFILAAGGIEIPRLLLLSNEIQREGLGNQHDLVGRFFMQHLHFWPSGIFVPSNLAIFNSTALYSCIHVVNGVPVIGKLSLSGDVLRRERLLNYVTQLSPHVVLRASLFRYPKVYSQGISSLRTLRSAIRNRNLPDDFSKHLSNVTTDFNDVAMTVYRNMKSSVFGTINKKRSWIFHLLNMSEQVPNPDSRVTLAPDCDSLGQNRVRLDWKVSPVDIQSAIRAQEILDEELRRAGLGRLYILLNQDTPPQNITGGWHHMGTTRMHVNPRKGVVDENCQVHGIANLFIAGPSVFPTGGYANPSLTIIALATRLADHIKMIIERK